MYIRARTRRERALAIVAVASLTASLSFVVAVEAAGRDTSIDPAAWIRHPDHSFSIAAGEATVGQFRTCVETGACDASTVTASCNYGREGRDDHPINCITFDGAQQLCTWAGGRLCKEEEWQQACAGTENRPFPYGETFDAAACNVHPESAAADGGLDTNPVASTPTCQGGLPGLYDIAGNVAEWIDACKDTYCKFRGAGYLSNEPLDHFSGCGGVCSGNQKTFMSGVIGVRCCRSEDLP